MAKNILKNDSKVAEQADKTVRQNKKKKPKNDKYDSFTKQHAHNHVVRNKDGRNVATCRGVVVKEV